MEAGLPARKAQTTHRKALPHAEVASFLRQVAGLTDKTGASIRACFAFVVLTCVRQVEARKAVWREIDLDAATWMIPAERMKARREHRIPLSDQAVEILRSVKPANVEPDAPVFPSPQTGRAMSDMALLRCIDLLGMKGEVDIHGFRSSFRD